MIPVFTTLTSKVVPLDRANVDTDAIIPKQFMKSVNRTGFGDYVFDEWRYLDRGEPGQDCSNRPKNQTFTLNLERYQGAQILLARENFGCGSSREHAVWALRDFGIRVIIAPSFAEIFYSNCVKNGLLLVELLPEQVEDLFTKVHAMQGFSLEVDLASQRLITPAGDVMSFSLDADAKRRIEYGLDEIAITLEYEQLIRDYEMRRRALEPWVFEQAPKSSACKD
jgi:3-isopropylmalate/(R)-2-methylmalate dehydratase small subunit